MGRGDYQQATLPEERGERLGSEHSLEGHAPAEVGGGGSPARPVGIARVDILTSRDRERPFRNGGHRFQHFEQPFPRDQVRDEGRRERPGSAGRDLAGTGERRERRSREPVPSRSRDRGRKLPSGELSRRFRAGPARGKDPVHGLQIRALLLPEPPKFRFAPLGFGTLQVVDQRDDARPGPLPGEVFAEERPVQQFVLQHHVGRSGRILGVPAPGVPAPAVELANRHVVAPRPKSLDE